MANNLRTDSSDYRTELLSPAPDGENVVESMEPSWRLNIDKFHVPEKHADSSYGFGHFVRTLSKSLIDYTVFTCSYP